ncbi:MAG: 30S ribosomal protein S20 [Candidatus Spechtbacterales bacterium]|nr:30S ribosomal protein S20 [Candidatus Spechtbacterales bacterium]
MPNLQNAKKALRQSARREKLNRSYKNRVKKLTREFSDLVTSGKIDEAKKLLPTIYKAIDKSVKKGILHKNTASRRKSSLARSLNPKEEK